MNKIIFILLISSLSSLTIKSQIPHDYPFKIKIDEFGYIIITGEENGDIFTEKYLNSSTRLWKKVYYNTGFDIGTDVLTISDQSVITTGYITNQSTGLFDIILLKYDNASNGNILWIKVIGNSYLEDKSFGIVCDDDNFYYITGYETDKKSNKNIRLLKCSDVNGNVLKDTTFNNKEYNRDDVGTDILIDGYYLYVLGYTYNGFTNDNDVVQLTYNLGDNMRLDDVLIVKNKGKDTPTSFIISQLSRSPWQKSRTSMTVMTDNIIPNPASRDFLTMTLCGSELIWKSYFNSNSLDDVPTSITVYDTSLYVTGYSYRTQNNSDFTTIKYNLSSGSYGWSDTTVRYYDIKGGKDKGSSVKIKNRDTIYIAGTSEYSNNGFLLMKYAQTPQGTVHPVWERTFSPETDNIPGYREMHKASVIEMDSLDYVYQINYSWNETHKYYFIIKYDADGNQIYIINNLPENRAGRNQTQKKHEIKLNNHPNPFNPSTQIKFTLNQAGKITLRIYDISGREVRMLLSEYRQPGEYSETFDAGQLSSGVYFYSLYQDGVLADTRKCVLVK